MSTQSTLPRSLLQSLGDAGMAHGADGIPSSADHGRALAELLQAGEPPLKPTN